MSNTCVSSCPQIAFLEEFIENVNISDEQRFEAEAQLEILRSRLERQENSIKFLTNKISDIRFYVKSLIFDLKCTRQERNALLGDYNNSNE